MFFMCGDGHYWASSVAGGVRTPSSSILRDLLKSEGTQSTRPDSQANCLTTGQSLLLAAVS